MERPNKSSSFFLLAKISSRAWSGVLQHIHVSIVEGEHDLARFQRDRTIMQRPALESRRLHFGELLAEQCRADVKPPERDAHRTRADFVIRRDGIALFEQFTERR